MRWLCDEHVPRRLVDALRQRGHDVTWIREEHPGIADADVLALAIGQKRLCLTFDKDFGELVASIVPPIECGVVLIRVAAVSLTTMRFSQLPLQDAPTSLRFTNPSAEPIRQYLATW